MVVAEVIGGLILAIGVPWSFDKCVYDNGLDSCNEGPLWMRVCIHRASVLLYLMCEHLAA